MSNPYTLTPTEYELPTGELAVASNVGQRRSTQAVTVPAEKRPLYELLFDLLESVPVPDLFPANLARECSNLVDAIDTLEDITRGSVEIGNAGYGMGYCYTARDAIAAHRDRDPIQLVAAGCSGSKHDVDEPTAAKDLYRGGYWTNKREYYEEFSVNEGRIISAEHALLHPDQEIDHYETTPDDLRGIPVDHDGRLPNGDPVQTKLDLWAYEVHNGLTTWCRDVADGLDPRDVHLEILLGKTYENPLRDRGVFDALRIQGALEVSFPFREEIGYSNGGGIGNQRSWMAAEVEAARTVATDGGNGEVIR